MEGVREGRREGGREGGKGGKGGREGGKGGREGGKEAACTTLISFGNCIQWTPLGQKKVSFLERCPYLRG